MGSRFESQTLFNLNQSFLNLFEVNVKDETIVLWLPRNANVEQEVSEKMEKDKFDNITTTIGKQTMSEMRILNYIRQQLIKKEMKSMKKEVRKGMRK